ncbi:MAG: hypothetical protein LKJ83_03875 [Eubacteriaceae bacterium]|jgi:hypothetical protein|nr:hypothetical protein [Eubacteriaceae bacterium]
MNKIIRTAAAALLIAVMPFCLAACGSGSGTGSSASASTASVKNTELKAGTYTVTIGGKSVTYKAAYIVDGIDATISGGTYKAAAAKNKTVFLVCNGGSLTISDATVKKSGSGESSGDDYNFYGTNSAIVVVGKGSKATISNVKITTDAEGANAIFATKSGSADVSDTTITTTENSSRGLDATYSGIIDAKDMTITTSGEHCATLATDRGGGTVTVTGTNKLTTKGDGSPIIYSTGDISADGVTGSSAKSQAVVVEGKNKAALTNSKVTVKDDQGIMMYQSMSGDAADQDSSADHSTCVLKNTTIVTKSNYPMIYITNTKAKMKVTNVTFTAEKCRTLIKATSDRWGTSGSNGGTFTLTAHDTKLSGRIKANSISSIVVKLLDGSVQSGSTSGSVTVTNE